MNFESKTKNFLARIITTRAGNDILRICLEIREKPTEEIISGQQDIEFRQFTEKDLEVLKKITNGNAAGPNKIRPYVWKTIKFNGRLHLFFYSVYEKKNNNW